MSVRVPKGESGEMNILLDLFFTFAKIGLFTFGGGYAMIAMIENNCVERKKWITHDEMMNVTVIAESTPGPIAINCATYLGYKHLGVLGSLMATVGVVIPSFVIIFTISLFFDAFLSFTIVEYAFRGIQACVIYLIFSAGLKMLKSMKKSAFTISIVTSVALCMLVLSLFAIKFSTIFYILICGLLGIFVYLINIIKAKKEDKA
jgi:chromate transporter